jgi:formate hydrogenlyase subunit 3/multisubunit Na+/H+ antiporter MnhD subunit
MATTAFFTMCVAFATGIVAAAIWPGAGGRRLSLAAAGLGCLAALVLAGTVLFTERPWHLDLPNLLPQLGGVSLSLDSLGAFFLAIVGFTGAPAALYGVEYLRPLDGRRRGRAINAGLNLFLAGMCLVPAADNVITFLFSWELMAVSSYVLVICGAREDEAPAAGLWYAVMTHAGFIALVAAFLTLAHGGALDFPAMRAHAAELSSGARLAVFLLGLLAFGSKAGLVPLHVWLPRAHPAAPSHVSALLSAAMVKLGVYGSIRLFFDLLPIGPPWWGGALLTAGVVTALTGVLYSVADPHLKRVLAYSTIENVGLIFVGLGFALLMRGYGYTDLAAMGLIVCLLHTLNHAAFKTLLFLGAGAVIHRTHQSSLEAYGGLVTRMPQTAVLCFIGALSLAALPPLNGFPSEWLTFQLLVAGARHTAPELAILLPLALAAVAFVAGLAAVSAVRLFGIAFLALPRTPEADAATEVGPLMRGAMAVPALACIALGLMPAAVVPRLAALVQELHLPLASLTAGSALSVPLAGSRLWSIPLALGLVGLSIAAAVLMRAHRRAPRSHLDVAWNCGRAVQSARTEYTAAAFAEPLKRVFTGFYRPTQEITVSVHPASPYFVRSIAYRGQLAPWMEQTTYGPVIRLAHWASLRMRRLQMGSIHVYLALLPAALLVLLLLSRWIH